MDIFRNSARIRTQTALALVQQYALITILKAVSLSSIVFIVDFLYILKKVLLDIREWRVVDVSCPQTIFLHKTPIIGTRILEKGLHMKKNIYIGAQERYVILRKPFNNSPYYVRSQTWIASVKLRRLSQRIAIPECIFYEI